MMAIQGQMHLNYDSKYDILYVDIGEPCVAYGEKLDDGIYLRINPKDEKPVGVTIMAYKRRKIDQLMEIPLNIDWVNVISQTR